MSAAPTFEQLFDPDFLGRLQPLSLRVALTQKGGRPAGHDSSARGQGGDFVDFKPYVAGDDLRTIDWNVYRRLGKAFVHVSQQRLDLPVYFMIDVSRSMFIERPARIGTALRTALALAAVALAQHDSVGLLPFSDTLEVRFKALSGSGNLARVARALSECSARSSTSLSTALEQLLALRLRRGLLVVISDFFDDAGIEVVLEGLRRVAHTLLLVQIVKPYDADPALHPELHGEVLLDDGERGSSAVSIDAALCARYQQSYREFTEQLQRFADERGTRLARIDAERDVLDQLTALFAGGSLRL